MTSGNNKIDKRRASLAPLITYTPWRRGASVARFGGFECFSNAFGWCGSLNGKVFPWWVVGLTQKLGKKKGEAKYYPALSRVFN